MSDTSQSRESGNKSDGAEQSTNNLPTTRRGTLRLLGGGAALSSLSGAARAGSGQELPEVLSETGDGETRLFAAKAWDKYGRGTKVQLGAEGVVAGSIECDDAAVDVTVCEDDCVFLGVTGERAGTTTRYTASLETREARAVAEMLDRQATGPTDQELEKVAVEDVHAHATTQLGDLGMAAAEGRVGGFWVRDSDGVLLIIFGANRSDGLPETGAAPHIHPGDVDDLVAALREGARRIER